MDRKSNRKKLIDDIGYYSNVGIRFALIIIIFLFLGNWLDDKTGLRPLFTLIFVFWGASLGFYSLYRSLIAYAKKNREK